MEKIITIIVIFLHGICLHAQTITVKDKSTLQPLENVFVNGNPTNAKGQIAFETIKNSLNKYVFSRIGYFSDSLTSEKLLSQNYTVLLAEKSYDFKQVIASVSRFEEKMEDVAQQAATIDKLQMQFMNQPTTAELLQQSGRAFIQKSQMGGGSVVMRGFEANKVLMVVDGVRMNNAIYRGGHLQNVLSVDNNMLEKTEMLFGPGSVVYGSDALGGVVHFFTKNPTLSPNNKPLIKAMAFTRYGTAMNEKTGHFDFNLGFRKIAFLGSVTYSDFGDMTIGKKGTRDYESWGRRTFYSERFDKKDSMVSNSDSFKQIPSGYKQMDIMGKLLFRQNKYVSHLLNMQFSNTTDIPRYDRLSELGSNGKPLQAQWYYGPQIRNLFFYKLSVDKKMHIFDRANVIAAYQDIEESRHNRGFQSTTITHRTEHVNVLTFNADFEKMVSSKTELRYGIELTGNDVQSKANKVNVNTQAESTQSTRYPDGGSKMRTMAMYMTQNNYLSKKLVLNTGIRFTSTYLKCIFNDKTFFPFLQNSIEQRNQNTSGNIGLVYLPGKEWKVATAIATGFRSANVDDMAKVYESIGGRIIVPNAYVKPEQTTNFDLTINKTIAKKYNIEWNGYYTLYSNALTVGKGQLDGKDTVNFGGVTSNVYTTLNAQRAYIYGTYFAVNLDITKAISVNANVNYTYGRIKTDTTDYPLDHISPVYGKLGIMYKGNKFKVELFSLFNGAKKSADYNLLGEDNQLYSADPKKGFNPAWQTINLRGFYQINKILQVQLAFENILDQHYRTFSSGYSAPGRNVVLALRGNF